MAQTVLTNIGFKRKRYDDFLSEMQDNAREYFGSDINLDDDGPLGKLIKLWAYARADENELAEAVYLSSDYTKAEGLALDAVIKGSGVTRLAASKAVCPDASFKITVDPGKTVNSGFLVATTSGIGFQTTETATDTDNDGFIYTTIEAINTGYAGNVPANAITVITTPTIGVYSVTNTLATAKGRDVETDKELRKRIDQSGAILGSGTTDSIRAKLLNNVVGVRAAKVFENTGDTTDANGRPPHCIEAVLDGGSDADVANMILSEKVGGIKAHGTTTISVTDSSGNEQLIGFTRATQIDIYIHATLTKNSSFPTDGNEQVQNAVISYIGGTDNDNVYYNGLGMDDDVIYNQIVKQVTSITGVDDAVITISKDNVTFASSNISIGNTEVAQTDIAKVVVS